MLSSTALVLLICVAVVRCDSSAEQNGFAGGVKGGQGGQGGQGGKAKKIQIVYIKVPLSKVLQSPNDGYNTGERGYSEGGGGGGSQGYDGPNGIPGEGRVPTFSGNNIGGGGSGGYGGGGGGYGDNYGASNQNSYDSVKSSGPEGWAGGQQNVMFANQEGFANNGPKEPTTYGNDANLGMAYGAAVGNALPQTQNFEDSGNYGQESQNSGYAHSNQINYESNGGYGQNPPYNRPQNDGYGGGDGYGVDSYEKGKLRPKGNQHYPKMMANFRPQIPIMSTLPSFSMKGFNNPQFATSFPTFGGQFPTMGGITGVSGISGIGGLTGGMKGFGGIKSKLSLLLGNKFGMGGTGGLLGGMMGWD